MGVTRREQELARPQHHADAASSRAGVADDRLVRQAELIIAYVLRGGVLLSAAVVLLGVALYALRGPTGGQIGARPAPSTIGDVIAGVGHGDPRAIIALGLLILLATPVLRVAVSVVTFALERDWRYVAITAAVLAILILSF